MLVSVVNPLDCPKGWTHFGGSCYYLSKVTSTSTQANATCNPLHSNLIQIRNTVELLYAAHVVTKNNLSALMIDIDPNLLKGNEIFFYRKHKIISFYCPGGRMIEISMDDQGQWQRMTDKFRASRVRYYKFKNKFIDELNAAGLRISTQSTKIKQKFINERNGRKYNVANDTIKVDEYEYVNLDSEDESDELKQMDDIRGICDRIDWNVRNNNSAVYKLTTSLISQKMICSLSDVEPDIEYRHICQYGL